MKKDLFTERKIAVMQLRQGKTETEVANDLNRSLGWVSKWKRRYAEESWTGLKDKSRAPTNHGNELSATVKQAICQARMELEAEAELGVGLKYIGGQAIRTRLKQNKVTPLPSIATIERVISAAGLTGQTGNHLSALTPHTNASTMPSGYCAAFSARRTTDC